VRGNCFSETEVSENVRGLAGYWGPSEGLTLGLRKARPNPFWDRKRGLHLVYQAWKEMILCDVWVYILVVLHCFY